MSNREFESQPVARAGKLASWQRLGVRAAACVLGGGIAATPLAVSYGFDTAHVHDDVGAIPANITPAPGQTEIDLGPFGRFYNPNLTSNGNGLNIQVDNPPDILSTLGTVNTTDLRQLVEPYVGLYQQPEVAARGYADALSSDIKRRMAVAELAAGLAFALAGFGVGTLVPEDRRKRATAMSFGGILMLSTLASGAVHQDWLAKNALPQDVYAVPSLDGTKLEGTVASSEMMATAADRLQPLIQKEVSREQQANQEFLEQAYASIDAAIAGGAFESPNSDETVCLVLSDLHSNHDMIKVYQYLAHRLNKTYGKATVGFVVFVGDETDGSAAEKDAVDEMAKISDGQPNYAIAGNHDGKITKTNLRKAGVSLLSGKTVKITKNRANLSILGGDDPMLTKVEALFGFGDNVSRTDNNETEAEAGQKILKEAKVTDPSIIIAHEAYETEPIIGLPDLTKAAMKKWFAAKTSRSHYTSDEVPDIASSALIFGHWHDAFNYRVVWNSNGGWTDVIEAGSAGGAIGNGTPTHFTTPWTVPGQQASALFLTFDNDSGKVRRIQEFATSTKGVAGFNNSIVTGDPVWKQQRGASSLKKASR